MNNENKIYVAYGSNLNLEQMQFRCPYATAIGNGILPDYQLLFRGGDGSSVATVESKKDSEVPILLWEITPRDEESLDRYEGYPYLYRKETVEVQYGEKLVEAMIYIMNEGKPIGTPSGYYFNAILEGYKSAGFDRKVLEQAVRISKENKA